MQHSVYVGRLWVSQELRPGGVGVTFGWRKQLQEVRPLLEGFEKVWVRLDNAYYSKGVVDWCRDSGWDFSISVTNETYKPPLWEEVEVLDPIDGIRTVIRDLIRTAGRLVRHSRRWILRFAKTALRVDWLAFAAGRLEALPLAPDWRCAPVLSS